ncbi:MAG: trigger factor [Candidatus Nealsonbacteria bacterium RBG_13_36_15]|uniref:Trigger factor n=1 Tax=Candidatus Nealsonbacteria bacterium RBG_13_36_15 TaxID=1801660 RepID=A0A1G2DUX9_9BACT|nr:MAG: trigger factor [Candidatus Nealsonbacteria bacterium RBG_13_36_15]
MEFEIKKLPKSQVEIEIKISSSEFQGAVDKAIFRLGQNLEIEGFRKGKAPKNIIEKNLGQDIILKTASQSAIKESYLKIISENKIKATSNPEIKILSPPKIGDELSFKVKISVFPEIILPDYKKIVAGCEKRKVSVGEKEIKDALSWLQRSRAKFSQIVRPAQKNDFIEIEFSSPNVEGNLKKKDSFLLGQGHLIPGFEEKLEGMEAGQEKQFSLQFPKEHFQKDLAGKEVNFEVKMISVQKMELPELDDQFAKSLGQFENLTALERNVNQGLNLEKELQEQQRLRQEIIEKIINEVSCELPEALIAEEQSRLLEGLKKEVANKFQISFEEYLRKIKETKENLWQSLKKRAEIRIKGSLVLNKISTIENIKVTEEEIKDGTNKVLAEHQSAEEAKKGIDLEKLKLYIENDIRNEKTLEKLESFSNKKP